MRPTAGQRTCAGRLGSGSGPSEKSAGISATRTDRIGRRGAAEGGSDMFASGCWLIRPILGDKPCPPFNSVARMRRNGLSQILRFGRNETARSSLLALGRAIT